MLFVVTLSIVMLSVVVPCWQKMGATTFTITAHSAPRLFFRMQPVMIFHNTSGLYYKNNLMIASDARKLCLYYKCFISPSLRLCLLVSSVTTINDAPNCGVTNDRYSFIIQATDADGLCWKWTVTENRSQ